MEFTITLKTTGYVEPTTDRGDSHMKMFAFGFYVCGAIATFFFVGAFVALGGNSAELWKPIIYAIFWPIAVPLFLLGYL